MSDAEDQDILRETADDLLANAERCYRLARGTTDFSVREKLIALGQEFETRAEAVRAQARSIAR